MKMPSKRQFCGYCELPVMKHRESTGLIAGVLYHKRRCYPKHLKEVKRKERDAKKSDLLHSIPSCLGTNGRNRGAAGQQSSDDSRVCPVPGNPS